VFHWKEHAHKLSGVVLSPLFIQPECGSTLGRYQQFLNIVTAWSDDSDENKDLKYCCIVVKLKLLEDCSQRVK
jgi:hypothetical protein